MQNASEDSRVTRFQTMVEMSDGVRLNTFVFLPAAGGPRFPVIVQRTPYGITASQSVDPQDCTRAWLPTAERPLGGSILRGWEQITAHGYAAVYQDTRGRHGSEGEDRVYADDADDGHQTLAWTAAQPWCNQYVGVSGSSAGATTAMAAASRRHPSLRAMFVQVGGSSIYDDVVYEGQSIELERLWLWVGRNLAGLSAPHRDIVMQRLGLSSEQMDATAKAAMARCESLEATVNDATAFTDNPAWMHLPLSGYPNFSIGQPWLDEIITHPGPDEFRAQHNFRRTIDVPGLHATTWFDIFQTSVIAAFNDIQGRVGNQQLWIAPNDHFAIYRENFWPHDPYFEWFDHWLKGKPNDLVARPSVHYSPRAWVDDPDTYQATDWRYTERWPPAGSRPARLYLCSDGSLCSESQDGEPRSFRYDPRHPVTTCGGRNMLIAAGPLDQSSLYAHHDYGLCYRGSPLEREVTLAGEVRVTLNVQSDCPDTDFVAKLIQCEPDGNARLLMDGVIRTMYREPALGAQPLTAGSTCVVTIHLAHIYHTVPAGCRMQIDITSSNFPRRARNTNSGNPVLACDSPSDIRVATNTVLHSNHNPSYVTLPVLA
jgi:uncharacterized protein